MEIQELFRVITQRWRVVLITALLCVSVALGWSLAGPVSYQAQGKIVISTYGSLGTANDAYAGEQVSEQRAPTYAQLLRSPEVSVRAAKKLGNRITAEAIENSIDARIVARLPLVIVTATMPTANDAVQVVAAVEQAFQEYVTGIERPGRDGSLTAVRLSGDAPSVSRQGDPLRYAAIGLVIGLVVGTVIAVYRDRTDPVTRSPGQISTVGCRHLGTIEFPSSGMASAEPFRRLAVECAGPTQDFKTARVLVVGVDSDDDITTAVAHGLAMGFVALGRDATFVSALPDEWSSKAEHRSRPGLSDVLDGSRPWDECVFSDAAGHPRMGPGTAAEALDAILLDETNCRRFLRPSTSQEHIVIAGPSIVQSAAAVSLTAVADSAVIVASLGKTHVADIVDAKLTLAAMNCPNIGLVLVHKSRSTKSAATSSEDTLPDDSYAPSAPDIRVANDIRVAK
jgi:non-specific protein-tyrosine kinase